LLLATSENERRRQQKMIDSRQWPPKSLQSLSREAAVAASQVELPGGGLWLAQSGWLNPASLCRALLTAGSVEIRHDAEVAQLISAGGGWQIRDRAGRPCGEAEVIIIANGRGAATFVQTRWLPLSLIRGQTTRLRATPQSRRLSSVLCAGVYLTPAIGEHHILGATFQRDEKAIDLRATDDEENMRQLAAVAPALASSLGTGESQHAAIRAATPDRLPAVGAVVDYAAFLDDYAELWKGKAAHHYPPARHLPGLYLMAGFGARGITTAPLAAELLAAMIDGTELPVDAALADALNPARFLIKRLRRAAIDPDQAIQ
jgi:tRNA 5-methylaminomethyl-2-thiouridine biosynthesis bifunctional protein